MSDIDNINYLESDDNEEIIQFLKEKYTLKDFLKHPTIGEILKTHAIWDYEEKVEPQIEKFYKEEVDVCNYTGATVFNHEVDYAHLYDLFKIIFNNIELNYDEKLIFDNPALVKEFVDSEAKKYDEES